MLSPITPEIEAIWRSGRKIEAIKLLRKATGWGLAETKTALEATFDGAKILAPSNPTNLVAAIEAALARGDKLIAIKLLKDATGLGLKEAKDRIESGDTNQWLANASGPPAALPISDTPAFAAHAAPPGWSQPGFEPGRVQSSSPRKLILVALVAAAAAAWYLWLR